MGIKINSVSIRPSVGVTVGVGVYVGLTEIEGVLVGLFDIVGVFVGLNEIDGVFVGLTEMVGVLLGFGVDVIAGPLQQLLQMVVNVYAEDGYCGGIATVFCCEQILIVVGTLYMKPCDCLTVPHKVSLHSS